MRLLPPAVLNNAPTVFKMLVTFTLMLAPLWLLLAVNDPRLGLLPERTCNSDAAVAVAASHVGIEALTGSPAGTKSRQTAIRCVC